MVVTYVHEHLGRPSPENVRQPPRTPAPSARDGPSEAAA